MDVLTKKITAVLIGLIGEGTSAACYRTFSIFWSRNLLLPLGCDNWCRPVLKHTFQSIPCIMAAKDKAYERIA